MANTKIPTVDLSPFLISPKDEENGLKRKACRDIITKACSEYGFFLVENHGIPLDFLNRALELSKTFFEYEEEEKLKCLPKSEAPLPAGYFRHPKKAVDHNEYILMFSPESGFNTVPSDPPELKEALEQMFNYLTKLGQLIESIISECLGLPQSVLKEYNNNRSWDFLVALNYFPATTDQQNKIGAPEHEDGNILNFVVQDDVGGLQVKKDGEWIPVIPEEGKIVVNVGDTIQVLTNNKFKSAIHRVVSPEGRSRYSFAFSYGLGEDKRVEPLPQFSKDIGEPAKYRRFMFKEYQDLRMRNKTHPPSRPEDVIKIRHYAI